MKYRFEENLLFLLRKTGTSNSALGRAVNATPATVQNWLSGKTSPKISTALMICEYFGVTISEIVGETEITEERMDEIIAAHIDKYGSTRRVEMMPTDWSE